jgi:fatty-acid desaturase
VFAFLLEAMHNPHHADGTEERDRQWTYDVTLRGVRATIFVVQMQ